MKIAIIGTGIAGNAASWLLHHQNCDITVFEKNGHIGGHANTVDLPGYPGVDTGFMVYNETTAPNLVNLFDHLGIPGEKTDMSFALSIGDGMLEYADGALFAQTSNLFKPGFHRMGLDFLRFYRNAPKILRTERNMPLGEYLKQNSYSKRFINHHILPLAGAIWSTSAQDMRSFPLHSFMRVFTGHNLFRANKNHGWRTIQGGSKTYVEAMTQSFRHKIRLNTPVTAITRHRDFVLVNDEAYDQVIIAAHADQALGMLTDPAENERQILSLFPYSRSTACLHTDETLMPRRKKAWRSWNYLDSSIENGLTLTYWINRIQPSIGDKNLFMTLNPVRKPALEKILCTIPFEQPQFGMDALKGWPQIKTIQGQNRTWFCGAWCGHGFHEDGISSGLAVAENITGIGRPWTVLEKSPAGMNCSP